MRVRKTVEAEAMFKALPAFAKARVNAVFGRLSDWPDVSGAKPLRKDRHGSYRIRTGDYRVIFTIEKTKDEDVVVVTQVGHRRDVYDE